MAAKGKENFINNINTMDITFEERWKVHQMLKQRDEIRHLWFEIQDIVAPGKLWPHLVRKLFWTKGVKHDMRPIISAFVVVNGLNPEVSIISN